jgi:hypothetical protein
LYFNRGRHLFISISLVGATASLGCTNAKLLKMIVPYPTVTVEVQNYCPYYDPNTNDKQNFSLKDVFVYNSSASWDGTVPNNWTTDFDRDGLSDNFELLLTNINTFGVSWLYADTSNNGYSDLVKVRQGILSGAFMPSCNSLTDTDGDGLNDCEENYLGTQASEADTDQDGIPDYIEYRFGMNPNDPNDTNISPTGDGYTNYQKAKWGVPAQMYMTAANVQLMTVYKTSTYANASIPSLNCYTFDISNIPVLPVVNGNLVQIQVVEDNQYPATGGLTSLDREVRNHRVVIPQNIQSGVTIIVPDGVGESNSTFSQPGNTAIVDGVDRPLQIVGGS